MKECCCNTYNLEFDATQAQKDLQDYLSNGPKNNTSKLLEAMNGIDLRGLTLMDIGGGVGAVVLELFKKGIDTAIHIEISEAYSNNFLEEAKKRKLTSKIQSYQGDFLVLHDQVKKVDVVVLDKAICCYDNFYELVFHSLKKANKWYAFIIPRDTWWVKLYHYFDCKYQRLKGKDFKTFIHPVTQIEHIIKENGFEKYHESFQREWLISVYRKS